MNFEQLLAEGKAAFRAGEYLDSFEKLRLGMEARPEELLPDQIADVYYHLGKSARKIAKFDEAQAALEKAISILRALEESAHSLAMVKALDELGMNYYEQSKFDQCEDLLNQALKLGKASLQAPSKHVACVLKNLAILASKRGSDTLSLSYCEQALDILRQTVGDAHEDYGEVLDNKGLVLQQTGKLDEAEKMHRQSLKIRENTLGPNHPYTAYSVNNLAQCLKKQKKEEDIVLGLLTRVVSIWQKAYGEKSPKLAVAINNLGGYYLDLGKLNEAAHHFEKAIEIKESVFGADNPALTRNLNNLAIVYKRLQRTEDAERVRNRAISLMQASVESEQSDIDTILILADSLHAQKKFSEAQQVLLKALALAEKDSGSETMKTAKVLRMMAVTNYGQNPEMAKEYYTRVLRIHKRELGPKHPQLAETLRLLAHCFTLQGDTTTAGVLESQGKAIEFLAGREDPQITIIAKRLTQLRQIHGDKSTQVLGTMRMLADMYRISGKTKEADALSKEYLQAREELLGPNSLELANELLIVATTAKMRNEHRNAIDTLTKVLQIQENAYGGIDLQMLTTLMLIASAYESLKEPEKAEEYYKRHISIIEILRNPTHWSLRRPLESLQKLAEAKGEKAEALALKDRLDHLSAVDPVEQQKLLTEAREKAMSQVQIILGNISALVSGGDNEVERQ